MAVSKFGEFIRQLRIDNGEILKDMAKRFDVTSAFLSAMENGKKQVPEKWFNIISKEYNLNKAKQKELKQAIDASRDKVIINTKNRSDENRELAIVFARSFGKLDENTLKRIKKLLEKEKM